MDFLDRVITVRGGRVPVLADALEAAQGKPSQSSSHAVIEVRRAIPESHWDRTNRLFFRSFNKHLVFAVCFTVRLGQEVVKLLCLIDQREASSPSSLLLSYSKHCKFHQWFHRRKSAIESSFWDELPSAHSNKERSEAKSGLDIVLGEVSYTFTAKLAECGDLPGHRAATASYELFLGIRQQDTADNTQERSRLKKSRQHYRSKRELSSKRSGGKRRSPCLTSPEYSTGDLLAGL
ncbi:hypothetical protein VTI74DRAFT_7181 [Chaetomium olivicolor]